MSGQVDSPSDEFDQWSSDQDLTPPLPEVKEHSRDGLFNHISQLEDLVMEMRDSLGLGLRELAVIQGADSELADRIRDLELRFDDRFQNTDQSLRSVKHDFDLMADKVQELSRNQTEMRSEIRIIVEHLLNGQNFRRSEKNRRSKSMDLTTMAAFWLNRATEDKTSSSGRCSSANSNDQQPTGHLATNVGSPEDGYASDSSASVVVNQSLELCRTLRQELAPPPTDEDTDASSQGNLRPAVSCPGLVSGSEEVSCQVNDSLLLMMTRDQDFFVSPKRLVPSVADDRYEIALELLRTERHYCNSLWNVQENIYEPLRMADLIPVKDLSFMFPEELFRIYEQHCILLHQLQDRLLRWDAQSPLADLYLTLTRPDGRLASLYADYVARFPKITDMVKKHFVKSTKVQKWLKRHSRVMTCRSDRRKVVDSLQIGAFLIFPVQRIPQYTLIFKRLIKHTTPEHLDREYLEQVLENLKLFGDGLNGNLQKSLLSKSDLNPPIKPKRKKYSLKKMTETVEKVSSCGSGDMTPTLYGKRMSRSESLGRPRGHSSAAAIIRRNSTRKTEEITVEEARPPMLLPLPPSEGKESEDWGQSPILAGGTDLFPAISEPALCSLEAVHTFEAESVKFRTSTPTSPAPGGFATFPRPRSEMDGGPVQYTVEDFGGRPLPTGTMLRRQSRRSKEKRNSIGKNFVAIKQNFAAFFSKKKNARRFNASGESMVGGDVRPAPFVSRPGAEEFLPPSDLSHVQEERD